MLRTLFVTSSLAIALLSSCGRPMAKFSFEGRQVAPATISFQNSSQRASTYEWDFGDGNTSTDTTPTHRYYRSGVYNVSLKAIDGKKHRMTEQKISINAPEGCLVQIETPFGTMVARLSDATPKHRDNFLKLAEQGFYDNLLFHRVIDGFMIQGGDPDSNGAPANAALGRGGPGYTVPAEFVDSLVHVKGALAAARMGDQVNPEKASSGSQFYIVQGRPVDENTLNRLEAQKNTRYSSEQRQAYISSGGTPFLDRDYTVFGQVIEGLEVIDQIAKTPTQPGDRPRTDVWMNIKVIK